MGDKYKVCVDGKFLGHYAGHTPQAVIKKACAANMAYHKDWIENAKEFSLKRGSKPEQIVGVE